MNWTPIIALFVLFILLTLIKRLKRLPSKQGQSDYRYRKLGKLFTPAERFFFRRAQSVCGVTSAGFW